MVSAFKILVYFWFSSDLASRRETTRGISEESRWQNKQNTVVFALDTKVRFL